MTAPENKPTGTRWLAAGGLGSLAAAAGLVALGATLGALDLDVGIAAAAHCLAVASCLAAARTLGPLTATQRSAVLITAGFVPVFGPALAWTFVRGARPDEVTNAHAQFEATEERERYQRSGWTGEFDRDLAREVSAVSYSQILRHGTLARKRNLLRSLASIGSPRHVAVIRGCLLDNEPELRLCAHAELDRLGRKHERHLSELREVIAAEDRAGGASARALAKLARASREYAQSGIFDAQMTTFWLDHARGFAERARLAEPGNADHVRLVAQLLVDLGRYDDASTCLDELGADSVDLKNLMIRAEIAFARRDFARLSEIAGEFQEQFAPVPQWISAMLHKSQVDPFEEALS